MLMVRITATSPINDATTGRSVLMSGGLLVAGIVLTIGMIVHGGHYCNYFCGFSRCFYHNNI